jgi:hypothetical protein
MQARDTRSVDQKTRVDPGSGTLGQEQHGLRAALLFQDLLYVAAQ